MKSNYIIDYVNENEFRKKERAVKKYNMLAYKKLLFDYYPSLREGKFLGVLVSTNEKDHIEKYELTLPTDKTFTMVHGNITLHYSVYLDSNTVMLETLTPEDILTEGHQKELTTYKGVMVSKSHKDLDMFKINLLNSMNKNGFMKIVNNPNLLFTISVLLCVLLAFLVAKLIIIK
ncbi:MAG: hypothetical protein IKI04_03055 [Bacilli bacterium]|nr:hypothetical protein [Bacilli bacterium]